MKANDKGKKPTPKGRFLVFYMVMMSCRKAPPEFRFCFTSAGLPGRDDYCPAAGSESAMLSNDVRDDQRIRFFCAFAEMTLFRESSLL